MTASTTPQRSLQLRAILVGDVGFLKRDLGFLNMGDYVVRDGNGRDQ